MSKQSFIGRKKESEKLTAAKQEKDVGLDVVIKFEH